MGPRSGGTGRDARGEGRGKGKGKGKGKGIAGRSLRELPAMTEMATRAAVLVAPVALGALAGRVRLFGDVRGAMAALNRYALYFAFPALVFAGIVDADLGGRLDAAFLAVVPVSLALTLVLVRALGGRLSGTRRDAGSIALVTSFGNVAYLGLPFVAQFLGAELVGLASVAVALYVTCSMLVGPYLLLRWSGASAGGGTLRRALTQPLLWAPVIGFAMQLVPDEVAGGAKAITGPIGASAAPVALFVLGLYLHAEIGQLRRVGRAAFVHVAFKTVALPAVTFGVCWLLRRYASLDADAARVFFVLSAMPAAITTFAIAKEFERGVERVTQTIVLSSVLATVWLPLALVVAGSLE